MEKEIQQYLEEVRGLGISYLKLHLEFTDWQSPQAREKLSWQATVFVGGIYGDTLAAYGGTAVEALGDLLGSLKKYKAHRDAMKPINTNNHEVYIVQ